VQRIVVSTRTKDNPMNQANPDNNGAANTSAIKFCYCDHLSAEFRQEHGIPDGFCGLCEICGQPGHTRHHPAPVAYTGAWCDHCYHILQWTWIFRTPIGWFILFLIAVLLVSMAAICA